MIPWCPIAELPDALKDGRQVLLWADGAAVNGYWSAKGAHFGMGDPGWSESHEGSALDDVTHFAEINAPADEQVYPTDAIHTEENFAKIQELASRPITWGK